MICFSKKVRRTLEEEENFKKSLCIFTYNLFLGQFSLSECANQRTCCSVNGSSTPMGYSKQLINGLKRLRWPAWLIWNWVFWAYFLYNLVIVIEQCKIQYKSLGNALLFSRNQVFSLKNWKVWRAPTTRDLNNFWWNFSHVPYFPISKNRCVDFFNF